MLGHNLTKSEGIERNTPQGKRLKMHQSLLKRALLICVMLEKKVLTGEGQNALACLAILGGGITEICQ